MGINVSAITYYKGTGAGDLEWAGYESGRRVVRYTLEATGAGATALSLTHKYTNYSDGTTTYNSPALCASLTTDGAAYINASGTENGYQAEMVKDTAEKTYSVSLEGLKLYPGQTYYLWVYPMDDTYAFAYYESGEDNWELTSSGAVSVALIGNGEAAEPYLAVIWDGTQWQVYVLVLWDGAVWKICSKED